MNYNRAGFNSNIDDDADQQRAQRHSRSNSGQQWAPPLGYINSAAPWSQDSTGGYYAGVYPQALYSQPASSFALQHPQYPGHHSGYIDPSSAYMNQASPSAALPQNPGIPFDHRIGNSGTGLPSFDPNAAQPTHWSTPCNSAQPHLPSVPRTHTPAPAPGGSSSRNNHGRHCHTPSTQIQLEPGDYGRDNSIDGRKCSHCHATSTPLWRRDPRTHKPLCNACGLYLYQRNELRPSNLIDVDNENPVGGDSDGEYDGPECSNCGTRKTSTWRRNKAGSQVCNACGVYERMKGEPRPLSLRNDKIRPRAKH